MASQESRSGVHEHSASPSGTEEELAVGHSGIWKRMSKGWGKGWLRGRRVAGLSQLSQQQGSVGAEPVGPAASSNEEVPFLSPSAPLGSGPLGQQQLKVNTWWVEPSSSLLSEEEDRKVM